MPKLDHLPPPGDDTELAPHIEMARAAGPAPMPAPNEQPDPPRGTPPADAGMSDDEIRRTRFTATTDVGLFAAGTEIREHHWSPARTRRLMAEGKIQPSGTREVKP